jgi:phage-related protein
LITFNDLPISHWGLHLSGSHEHDILPAVNDEVAYIPAMPGAHFMDTQIQPRYFSLELGTDFQEDKMELQRKMREVAAIFVDNRGKPKDVKLSFDYEPNKYYLVRYSGQLSVFRNLILGEFTLPLVAYNPFAFSNVTNDEIHCDSSIVTVDDDYSIDTVWIDDIHITTSQELETYVNGYAIRPTILITGSAENLTFLSNGKSFSLKNFYNVTFVIKGDDYTILKNGLNGFNERIGKDFLELVPGLNKILITGRDMDFKLSIIHRDQYM